MNEARVDPVKFTWLLAALCSVGMAVVAGCQVHESGLTSRDDWYIDDDEWYGDVDDDIQYHLTGPKFKLTRDAGVDLNCASDHEEGE
ncbi:MAG: hypothetical protein NXI22_08620 [bacterium]|nr:hypothetical protein [bacterium]